MATKVCIPEDNILNAARRLNMDISVLADTIGIAKSKKTDFQNGIMSLTQGKKLAKKLEIPFGFLYLPELPEPSRPSLPDFRTAPDKIPLDADFFETLTDIRRKLDWYADYLHSIDEKERLPFVEKYTLQDKFQLVVTDIRKTLGNVKREGTKEDYLRKLVNAFENQGILVFRAGIVRNATKRKLSPKMFRGFAIADPYTPAIFINTNDAQSAQLFTLLHEAAHIWLGENGVSSPTILDDHRVERFCNQVAAEFLLPTDEFITNWQYRENLETNLVALAKEYRVSEYVVIIKALEQNIVSKDEFANWKQVNRNLSSTKEKKVGGDFYKTLPVRNSQRFTETVALAAMDKRVLLRDGARLLNTRPENIIRYLSGK